MYQIEEANSKGVYRLVGPRIYKTKGLADITCRILQAQDPEGQYRVVPVGQRVLNNSLKQARNSSTRGDIHENCGGTWGPTDLTLEAGMPGLVDRCDKCGEERA